MENQNQALLEPTERVIDLRCMGQSILNRHFLCRISQILAEKLRAGDLSPAAIDEVKEFALLQKVSYNQGYNMK